MFEKYKNCEDVNKLVEQVSSVFNFTTFHEENHKSYERDIGTTIYTANTDDNWKMVVSFDNRFRSKHDQKHYYPEVKFERTVSDYVTAIKRDKVAELTELFQNKYTPDFDQVLNVIDIFIKEGVDIGIFNNVKLKDETQHISNYFGTHKYYHQISFNDTNCATVLFNKVLQKDSKCQGRSFKKAYINIEIVHLLSSDNELKPYFKIRLPYSATKKITCVIPLCRSSKMYMAESDNTLKEKYVDTLNEEVAIDDKTLSAFFKKELQNEVKNVIVGTLKIKKSELTGLTTDELKEYFILVEMVKI
jgi:putative sterol carrier protein